MEHAVLEQAMHAVRESEQQILRLLCQRYHLAAQLARALLAQGRRCDVEMRVSEVVSRLRAHNPGPLDDACLARVFETVIRATEPLLTSLHTANGGEKRVDIPKTIF